MTPSDNNYSLHFLSTQYDYAAERFAQNPDWIFHGCQLICAPLSRIGWATMFSKGISGKVYYVGTTRSMLYAGAILRDKEISAKDRRNIIGYTKVLMQCDVIAADYEVRYKRPCSIYHDTFNPERPVDELGKMTPETFRILVAMYDGLEVA